MKIKKGVIQIKKITKINIDLTPDEPGVYLFFNFKSQPIYIGKAKNLKRRLSSYLSKELSVKTASMISDARYFSYIRVNSEVEALLLEAKMVKNTQPRYNIELKDDKHPLYIRITKEEFPRVLTARKIDTKQSNKIYFGPFPSSQNVLDVLKMLRRIFPYSQHQIGKRKCLYSHIGLCNPCPNEILTIKNEKNRVLFKKQYNRNISLIISFLKGNVDMLRTKLLRDMDNYSKNELYEPAQEVRRKIEQIDYITQPITPINRFLEDSDLIKDLRYSESQNLNLILKPYINKIKYIERIECYDIAHLSGMHTTASMVTFVDGEADKSLYRHFKIRNSKKADDVAAMYEVAKRRIRYLADWGSPDLIVVDGGKAQVNAFKEIFSQKEIPVIGLAKRYETLIIPHENIFKQIKLEKGPAKNLLQRIRNEAHRFARRYHHNLIKKEMFS